ncbi:unnamed protein product [Closterium sp. Yama58-4]|nr:unnamed protein product [Closterium sp. Yama58-4]
MVSWRFTALPKHPRDNSLNPGLEKPEFIDGKRQMLLLMVGLVMVGASLKTIPSLHKTRGLMKLLPSSSSALPLELAGSLLSEQDMDTSTSSTENSYFGRRKAAESSVLPGSADSLKDSNHALQAERAEHTPDSTASTSSATSPNSHDAPGTGSEILRNAANLREAVGTPGESSEISMLDGPLGEAAQAAAAVAGAAAAASAVIGAVRAGGEGTGRDERVGNESVRGEKARSEIRADSPVISALTVAASDTERLLSPPSASLSFPSPSSSSSSLSSLLLSSAVGVVWTSGFNASGSHAPRRTSEKLLWRSPTVEHIEQCIARSKTHKVPAKSATNGYLLVTANGGLNQMRAAICDMVAVARIMNATLVVPELDHTSFWSDPSEFEDIFDLEHFVETLKNDIRVVRELPRRVAHRRVLEKFPISWSPFSYYREELLLRLKKHRVMRFPLTDSRLANNGMPESIQRLRCRANYRALRYTDTISRVASNLVARLRKLGPYIALHLRYEKDMLAFTGCDHGLSRWESGELRAMRLNNSRWKEKDIDGEARRKEGACPLTPKETALFLHAMGFPKKTLIYIAAGDIYGSKGLSELTRYYPNTFTHSTLATPEELAALGGYQNRLAAVDYTVAVESDVFAYTYEGNMARAVQGHRRFEGHRKTIIPDREAVVRLLDQFKAGEMTWNAVRKEIRKQHKGRVGGPHQREAGENPKLEENFYANPMPGCMCEVERQPGKAVKACRMEGGLRKCREVPKEEEAYI